MTLQVFVKVLYPKYISPYNISIWTLDIEITKLLTFLTRAESHKESNVLSLQTNKEKKHQHQPTQIPFISSNIFLTLILCTFLSACLRNCHNIFLQIFFSL